jgi:hypothetical protein
MDARKVRTPGPVGGLEHSAGEPVKGEGGWVQLCERCRLTLVLVPFYWENSSRYLLARGALVTIFPGGTVSTLGPYHGAVPCEKGV